MARESIVQCTIGYMEPIPIVVKAYYFAVQQTRDGLWPGRQLRLDRSSVAGR
jgi:hypothetical protein